MTVPTSARSQEEYEATKKSEARASKFSIYNMYRKDRWELLKRALELIDPKDSDEKIEDCLKEVGIELVEDEEKKRNDINVLRAYINGLKDEDDEDIKIKRYGKNKDKKKNEKESDYIFKRKETEKVRDIINNKILNKFKIRS